MATNTINLSIRMDTALKHDAEELLSNLGLNMTSAINIYLRQMVREQKIPFEISMKTPNAKTIAAMKEALEMEKTGSGKTFHTIDELRKDLLS